MTAIAIERRQRDGKDVILKSREFARESVGRSWWHFVTTFSAFGALVAAVILGESLAVLLPAAFLLGLVLVRIFILYHDVEHGALFRGSPIARAVLRLFGLLLLSPPSIWRRSHDHHHRNNAKIYGASIGSYPVMTRRGYAEAGFGDRLKYALSRHPVTILLGYLTIFLWGMCIRSLFVNPRAHWDSALAVVLHSGLLVALYLTSPTMALFLVAVPMLVASALGAYLFYAQHNFPGVRLRGRGDWDYYFAALHSSSFIRMGPILSWLTGNIGFHHVHHLNSRIPFYRLPETMAAIEELQTPGVTSLAVKDIWRCLRLKLWDVEADRMITFRNATTESVS